MASQVVMLTKVEIPGDVPEAESGTHQAPDIKR